MANVVPSRKLIKLAGLAALMVGVAVAGPAYALTFPVVWDLSSPPGADGTSHVFTSFGGGPTYDLTAFGFDPVATPHNLFMKVSTPDETGLGLVHAPSNEIGPNQYIDLVVPLVGKSSFALSQIYHLVVSSVQDPESFNIWGSNTTGAGSVSGAAVLLFGAQTNLSPNCSNVTDICDYSIDLGALGLSTIAVQGIAADVLINVFTTEQTLITPEPGTLLLLGVGLLAVGLARLRKM